MKAAYERALKEASSVELLLARMKLTGRRNLALAVGLVTLVIILWARWSNWILIVPAVIWFAAAGQHFHIGLIENEMKTRKLGADEQTE